MKKELKVWAMTCIAFWCLAPNYSQSQDSLITNRLEEVVVTASKFPKSAANTGKVLVVIDSAALQRAGGKDLSQVLAEQAGVYVNGANSNPGKDKSVYIRGAAMHQSLILIDGMPITDPSGVNGAIDLRLLPLGSVQRIEILKGSQSTLYGTDAMGGVINIITRDGTDRKMFLDALAAYGTYNTLDLRVSGGARLTPWASVNAGVSRLSSRGFSEARDTLDSGNFDDDAFVSNSFNLSLHLTPSSSLEVMPFFSMTDMEGGYDAGAFTDDPEAVYEADLKRFGVRSQYQAGRSDLSLLVSSSRSDRTFTSAFGEFNAVGNFMHSEVFWKYALRPDLDWITGFSLQHMTMDEQDIPSMSLMSSYTSLHYTGRQVGVEGGFRFNRHSEYGSNATFSLNPYWRAGRWKVFVNIGSGFKAPTLTQLFGQFGPNPDLRPEQSISYETGFQYVVSGLDFRLVVFDRTIENMIIYTSRYENVDQQHVIGLELEPTVRITPELRVSGYYALMDGEVTTQTSEGDSTYNDLIRKPRHALGASADWQLSDALSVQVQYRYYGVRDDRFFNLSTFTTNTVRLDPYSLLDVYMDFQPNNTWSVFMNLQNLLDEKYEEVYGYNVRGRTVSIGLKASF